MMTTVSEKERQTRWAQERGSKTEEEVRYHP